MARLNTRPSHVSTVGSSRYASATPAQDSSSDQENRDPSMSASDKGKQRAIDLATSPASSVPTPISEGPDARGQKRKRVHIDQEHRGEEEDDEEEDARFNKYFDPNQDPDQRRDIKRKSRALERDFQERRDDLLRDAGDGLTSTVKAANNIYQNVKQTNDATLDSRLLVNVSDLANKKTAQLVLGDNSTGVDVDEFLSKCITFMRNGGTLVEREDDDRRSTARRRRRNAHDDEDDEDEDDFNGDPLDFEVLGREACFPFNARPCVPSFLLGPLSVEKKHRTQTQRRARQSKDTAGRESRPEALTREDLTRSDENHLTAICTRIRKQLKDHIDAAESALSERYGIITAEDLDSERGQAALKKLRLADNGQVSLFDFVLNPNSFGQTVENLFYVSFLIKEGGVGVSPDSQGLPTLMHAAPSSLEQQRANKTSKHQAVFALDYKIWKELVDAFDVQKPLIKHRQEDSAAQIGNRGWYA